MVATDTRGARQIASNGSRYVQWGDVCSVETPAHTESWYPIPHERLVDETRRWFSRYGLTVKKEQHALSHEGARYFGTWDLVSDRQADDYALALGLRNAHDKRFQAGLAVGSRVLVCDNLAFSGEIVVARKHTRFIMRDLVRLIAEAFGKLSAMRKTQDDRISAYKNHPLEDWSAHDTLIRAVDAKVIPNADIPHVLQEWREPRHEEFRERSAWSLFNCFTEVGKTWNPMELAPRTVRLHALMDSVVGLEV